MIDGHCHLDNKAGSVHEAMNSLNHAALTAGVTSVVLLNLPAEGFSNYEVMEEAKHYNSFFHVFPSLNPRHTNAFKELHNLNASGAAGLKLHPRMHGYRVDGEECINLVSLAGSLGMPVLIDGFPDGMNLSLGNLPASFARLAEKTPDTSIAMGHAGGHKILDALMVAKYFKNIYLDISYTLLYYRNSNLPKDIAYSIASIRAERIFWGSDYPDRPYGETVKLSIDEITKMNLLAEFRAAIFENNVMQFLGSDH